MGDIKIGTLYIPVLKSVEFTGEPVLNPNIRFTESPRELFDFGIPIGEGHADSNTISLAEGWTSSGVGNGTTPLNGAELVFTVTERTPSSPTYGPWIDGNILIRTVDGQSTIQIDTSMITICPQCAPAYLVTDVTRHCFAVKYSFPDAADQWSRVNGYNIYTVNHIFQRRPDGAFSNESWALDSAAIGRINLPYYNKNRHLELYYDETVPPTPEEDPNEDDPDGPSQPAVPDGNHTQTYDPIAIPSLPTMGAATAGFITMYKLSLSTIIQFAADFFASTVWEAIKLFFANPMDFMVGCLLLPFEPDTGSSYYPKFGLITFEHAYPMVANQYKTINCGDITIEKYWGSCFDYDPYTKIQIWLPYIGYRDLLADEVMGMTINVTYHCDCLTGDCIAFVSIGVVGEIGPQIPRVIGQYYGNCGVRVPFGSVSFDSAISASINLMGAAASMALEAGATMMEENAGQDNGGETGDNEEGGSIGLGVMKAASKLTGATMSVVAGSKPVVQKGGAAGASLGYMGIQKPYIIRRIPRQSIPQGYINFHGYPSNVSGQLADFTGYAEVDDIQLNDIPALAGERAEIIKFLNGGVLL